MNCRIVVPLICCLLVCGQADTGNHRPKRSTDSPTFQEIKSSKPVSFKIAGTDCSFRKTGNDCPMSYRAKGSCNLNTVSSQLFPDVNLEESTDGFIAPAKFEVRRIDIFACQGNEKDGVVSFFAKSVESVELAPQQLTLGANTRIVISWNALGQFDPQKLEVKLKGFTSVGSDTRVGLVAQKSKEGPDYTLQFKFGTLDVNNFLAKFGIDASEMISSDLSFASSRMGLATLIMQDPEVTGLFSPGGGFEIVATGKIAAPELPADASKFFVIVQDFKEGNSDSANEGYGKPNAAVFALYENKNVEDTISSLTRLDIPKLNTFKGVSDVAITVATKEIFNINSKALRSLAEKFVPIEGLDIISKGLTITHNSQNSNEDIKEKNNQAARTILFRVEVTNHGLTWSSPQRIVTQMNKMVSLVWSLRECKGKLAIPFETKGEFMDIRYVKEKGEMEVRFNLTERVPVLKNGLVSLFRSTIILYSKEKTNDCSWKLRGEGRETILDELADITITQTRHRTTVHAIADIFDMETLMNRTHAKPFNEQYEKSFQFLAKVPFLGLRYEAVFEKERVLKFKGSAAVDGKPVIEVIYHIANGVPMLKLGFQFQNQYLYKVIRMFYREDKIKSTWIKFKKICISVKNSEPQKPVAFDRGCIRRADKTFSGAGIGFIAETLQANDCDGEKWKMCNFLKLYVNGVVDMTYVGQMLPERVTMITRERMFIILGIGLQFFRKAVISKLDSTKGGDRLSFEGDIYLAGTSENYPGKIYDDGTNKIMLHFESEAGSQKGRNLLNLHYARMDPIRSTFAIPTDQPVQVIELQSRLRIGSVEEYQLEFSGLTARQYISYGLIGQTVKFVGEKRKLKISNLYKAFDISDRHKFLKRAVFPGQVIVAYTSSDEIWDVKDFDLKVKKGLHIYGKMTLKTQETYETTINFDEQMQLQTVIHLNPLRYGKMANTSDGKPSFQHVNLFLHKDSERPELGPDLVCKQQRQELRGYAETVGLEGPFKAEMKRIGPRNFQYEIKLKGKLYKEVENAEITLTTVAEDSPKDFKFTYFIDITNQGKDNVNKHLRNVLKNIKRHAKKGRASAKATADDIKDLLDSYKQQRQSHLNEMTSIEDQIHNINGKVDLAMIDISADCINQCKTVMVPGIEWKEDCLKGSGGQRNMKCTSWKANKDKAINVMCLLKCEAKKTAAAGEAANDLEDIKVLVNKYREQKVLFEDIGKLINLIEQADEIARNTRELVDSKTRIRKEISKLLSHAGDLVELHMLKVDTDLHTISPPCLPFQIDFTLKMNERSTHNGVHTICFNGEFYDNVGIRMMRMKYPKIDDMYKALEEAELRFARINGIKKSLTRVEKDIRKASRRDSIPSSPVKDPIEKMLIKISKRRIPAFTLKGDKTVLAFHHYSPWATIRRSDVWEMETKPSYNVAYNASKFQEKSACHQTREIITEYKDISENLQQLSSNYKRGRIIYGTTKKSMLKDLESSRLEIGMLMNKTKLYAVEKRDMLYWYQFTKRGIDGYLQTFIGQLSSQNRRSLSYLRSELTAFYGREKFINHLGNLGSDALGRSKITGSSNEKLVMRLKDVGKELQRVLSMNLDEAEGVITKLKGDIQTLYNSADALCA